MTDFNLTQVPFRRWKIGLNSGGLQQKLDFIRFLIGWASQVRFLGVSKGIHHSLFCYDV